jgi:glyoxylase-like metal-dependent hydrolase (beta-lactamase superfamily II)
VARGNSGRGVSLVRDEVEPDVIRLRLSSWQGRLVGYDVSVYVVRGVLVDSGFVRARRALLPAIDELKPRAVIVTHWHEDHAGNVEALARRGVPMRMHAACEATLRARPAIAAYRHVVWGRSPRLAAPLIEADVAPLTVLELPGHTPDHLGVWDAERRILASGDLFLGVKVRVAHRHESPRRLVSSLRAAAAREPRLLLDAHRGPVHNATAVLRAKIAWLEETIGAIESRHGAGDSARAIARSVLGREAAVGYASRGEYSKVAFVRAVLEEARGVGGH